MMMPTGLLLTVWFLLCLTGSVQLVRAQNQTIATTHPDDARALNSIFATWKISPPKTWNISGELCSGVAINEAITIDDKTYNPLIKCNCDFVNSTICRITALKVYAIDVKGHIPPQLWTLLYLENLNLAQNFLTGSLSPAIGNLIRMEWLTFGINALSGPFPKEIGLLTELKSLALGVNNFSGSIPAEIGNCTKLLKIYLGNSGLTGEIPLSFANLVELEDVWMNDLDVTGPIPEFIGKWTKLTILKILGTGLSGPIPSSFSNLTSLRELSLGDISNGSSSLGFIKDMKSLSILVFRNSNITGTIPSNIGEYSSLQQVDLSFNKLHGPIPASLFNLNKLTHLFLGNNTFNGSLPTQKSQTLSNIDVSYNDLSGSLPSWVSLPNLKLNLVANNFTLEGLDKRYDRRLRDNPEITQIVRDIWKKDSQCTVEENITQTRREIIAWSREKHQNSQKLIEEYKDALDKAMSSHEQCSETISAINNKLLLAYQAEENFWKQRSRQLWLALGDKNTGYFHAITRGRKAINKFSVIEDKEGKPQYEEAKILAVFSDYFQELFTTQAGERASTVNEAITPCISEQTNQSLIAPPSPEEIKHACFSIHADKAPGPDGFSASFFQSNWETVAPHVILEIQAFFSSENLPRNINETHIRLIPKIQSPKKVAEYRPIALCTVYYKIISKILTLRLQPVLHNIIAENQSAFVPQRAISDNVLITHEALHYLKTSGAQKRCFMAVKTDMSKAYDRIEWDFIRLVMEKMGFHRKWVSWIMQCISTVSYSFLLNGSAQGSVKPQRGIRQGDPLSPYLFILCSEVLSGLCNKAQEAGRLTGIRVAKNCPRISHLLFADDTMFFCRSDDSNCLELLKILQKYEAASGQMINKEKSAITFSKKTEASTKERAKQLLGIQKEGGTCKYLGLPELFGRKKKDLFSSIVDRIRQKALSWSTKFLSTAGKTTMLRSVLAAMPTYTMSCFKIPLSLCKRIQSALTRFWWDASPEKKKMCWIAWDKLTLSKRDGGLGFKDIQSFNDALLAKISWRLMTKPSSLLARTLLGKYCKNSTFLECYVPNSASHGWRGICIGRDLLKNQLGHAIGTGEATRIWSDPWLSLSEPMLPMGPATKESQDLLVSELICPETQSWNIEKIRQLLPAHEQAILELRPSTLGAPDKIIWLPSKTGEYTSKSGYFEATKEATTKALQTCNTGDFNWEKQIWKLNCPPKQKFCMWKAMKNALPVGSNLLSRGINTNGLCPNCNQEETTLHLFFHCESAKQVWEKAPFKSPLEPSRINSLRLGIELLNRQINLPPSGIGEAPLLIPDPELEMDPNQRPKSKA